MTIKENTSALVEARKTLQENKKLRLVNVDLENSNKFLKNAVEEKNASIASQKDLIAKLVKQNDDLNLVVAHYKQMEEIGIRLAQQLQEQADAN